MHGSTVTHPACLHVYLWDSAIKKSLVIEAQFTIYQAGILLCEPQAFQMCRYATTPSNQTLLIIVLVLEFDSTSLHKGSLFN